VRLDLCLLWLSCRNSCETEEISFDTEMQHMLHDPHLQSWRFGRNRSVESYTYQL